MLPNNSNTNVRAPTLDERKALLWVRKHGPVTWPHEGNASAPRHATLIKCLQAGWTEFDPKRKRFDPVAYVLTEAGKKALEP